MLIFIAGLTVTYLVLGLLLGSMTTRLGYTLDPDVKLVERQLLDARTAWETYSTGKTRDDNYYDWDREKHRYLMVRDNVRVAFQKHRRTWTLVGRWMIVAWPVMLVAAGLFVLARCVYHLTRRGLDFALTPSKYEVHSELLGKEV